VKQSEIVLRVLADAALRNARRWNNLADLAFEASCSVSLADKVIRRLTRIGAVRRYGAGGWSVLDPERVTTILAVERNFQRDTWATTTREAAREFASIATDYALGGEAAAVMHLGGRNTIADIQHRIIYVWFGDDDPDAERRALPPGDEATIVPMDAPASRAWDGYTSPAQTYADLFSQPGWQASEFRRAMWRQYFGEDDWAGWEDP
jgi:hypothetical protein